MAIFYPASQLLADLMRVDMEDGIYGKDFSTILSLRSYLQSRKELTVGQYNLLLDLFNKYVVVPASITQIKRNFNYPTQSLEEFKNATLNH